MDSYKARIAIFTDSFLPQINGVVTSIIGLSKKLADRGYFVLIVAPYSKKINDFTYPNIKIKHIHGISASFYQDFKFTNIVSFKTYSIVKKFHIDLIHFHTPITVSYIGIRIAKRLRLPLIGTFHTFFADPAYLQHWIIGTGDVAQKASWSYSNLFYNSADLVTTPTFSPKEELLANGCTQPVRVVSNGIDPDAFDNQKADDIRKKYNLSDKVVLYTGRISHEKNLFVLIKAFIRVAKEDEDVKFILIGDGPLKTLLEERVENNGLSDRIIFLGSMQHEELITSGVFGVSKIFVTASTTETQSITILEAQCNGIVCIGPDSRGIPYLIKNGKNGIIVPPSNIEETSNAILKLLQDEELYKRMKEETLLEIKKHYIDNVVDEWEEIYNNNIYKYHIGDFKFKKGFSYILSAIPIFVFTLVKLIGINTLNFIKNLFNKH